MKRIYSLIMMFLIITTLFMTNVSFGKTDEDHNSKHKKTPAEIFRADMRKLWEDHIVWTRNVIFCLVDELPGTNEAVARLLKNQEDIGDAIKPFYGEEAGAQLTVLLKEHITIAAEVVVAAKNGNQPAFEDANRRWHENADAISLFLSTANPNLDLEEVRSMMYEHLELTTNEASARISQNYPADVTAYDQVHEAILMMADHLSDGIIKQFPKMFKK